MKFTGKLLIYAFTLSALAASAQAASPREPSLEWKGQYGGSIEAEQRVVMDANGWTRL